MALDNYEDTLTSYIEDEDRLVTYKWFSKKCEIHVNVAKDILQQYWEKYRNNKKIVATFLLIGQLEDKSTRVEIVKDSNLDTIKGKFVHLYCKHLYSLQKCLNDLELLAFVGDGDIRYSSIKSKAIHKISNHDNKKENKSNALNDSSNKFLEKEVSNKTDHISNNVSNTVIKKDNTKEKEVSKNKIPAANTSGTKTTVSEKTSKLNKAKPSKNNSNKGVSQPQSKQTGFNNLFGKASNKSQTSNKMDTSGSDELESSLYNNEAEMKEDKERDTKSLIKEKQSKEENKTSKINKKKDNENLQSENKTKNILKNNKNSKGKKRGRSQENVKIKRKRIIVDSSEDEYNITDDEEEKKMESEEEMEVDPHMEMEIESEEKVQKEPEEEIPTEKIQNGKRMVKKLVDKMYRDEQGFLVTKREHVYEPASDDDEDKEMKKEEPPKPKPVEIKTKKKQTTLNSFFKKS